VACAAERYQVIRRIAAGFAVFDVVYLQHLVFAPALAVLA